MRANFMKRCKNRRRRSGYTGMKHDHPLLLGLTSLEADALEVALVALAVREDAEGDPLGYAKVCDRVADRLKATHALAYTHAEEWLKAVGLGRHNGRPQG